MNSPFSSGCGCKSEGRGQVASAPARSFESEGGEVASDDLQRGPSLRQFLIILAMAIFTLWQYSKLD